MVYLVILYYSLYLTMDGASYYWPVFVPVFAGTCVNVTSELFRAAPFSNVGTKDNG